MFRRLMDALSGGSDKRQRELDEILRPAISTPREMTANLHLVRDRSIYIGYSTAFEGPETAARLISQTFSQYGARLTLTAEDAEVIVYILATPKGHFNFSVVSLAQPLLQANGRCGPRELTNAIMTGVINVLKQLPAPDEESASDTTQDTTSVAAAASSATPTGVEPSPASDDELDGLLASIAGHNRQVTRSLLTGDRAGAAAAMEPMAEDISALGELKDERAIGAILDALADAALAAQTGLPEAARVRDAAADALVAIGRPAIPYIEANLDDSREIVRQALLATIHRLRRQNI